MLGSDYTP